MCRFRHLLDLGHVPQLSELAEAIMRPEADGCDPFDTLMVRPNPIVPPLIPPLASCRIENGADVLSSTALPSIQEAAYQRVDSKILRNRALKHRKSSQAARRRR